MKNSENGPILARVADYYSNKIDQFGPGAKGVDWKDEIGQHARFAVLSRVLDSTTNPSIVEIGCGYGAFVDYCDQHDRPVRYIGYDVSDRMIGQAKARFAGRRGIEFKLGSEPPAGSAEYVIASGIFNVKFDLPINVWWRYISDTIDIMARSATVGIAFNCLTGHSHADRMQDRLFYPFPGEMLDLCLQRFGRKVTLIHDYDLYEFTVLIRK